MIGLRYRPGRLADVPNAVKLLDPERLALGPRVWSNVPALISELLKRQLAKAYIIEEGAAGRLRWFGLSAFIAQGTLNAALESPLPFRQFLLEAALSNSQPFLSR